MVVFLHPQAVFHVAVVACLRRAVEGVVFHLVTVPAVVAVCHHQTFQIFP